LPFVKNGPLNTTAFTDRAERLRIESFYIVVVDGRYLLQTKETLADFNLDPRTVVQRGRDGDMHVLVPDAAVGGILRDGQMRLKRPEQQPVPIREHAAQHDRCHGGQGLGNPRCVLYRSSNVEISNYKNETTNPNGANNGQQYQQSAFHNVIHRSLLPEIPCFPTKTAKAVFQSHT